MINNLQALRGYAAIIVVIFHVSALTDTISRPWVFANFDTWGASGVDIFFVLSGFIMIYTQGLKPKSVTGFALARIKRLVPIYWIITALWVALVFIRDDFGASGISIGNVGASLLFSSQVLGYGAPFLSPGWTLEFEMLFYLIFAFSILLIWSVSIVGISLCVLVVFFGTNPIVFEFLFGMLVCRWYFMRPFNLSPVLIATIGFLALLYLFFADIDTNNLQPYERLLYWGLPSVLLVAGLSRMRQIASGYITFLGSASYSIYLSHWCAIPVFKKMMKSVGAFEINHDLYVLCCTAFCISCGAVIYKLVELPISKFLNSRPIAFDETPETSRIT